MWGDGGVYGTWVGVMDRWARGEPADPATLPPLTVEQFDADTWARLANQITAALSARLTAWATATSRGMAHANNEFTTAQALAQARGGLRAIRAVASLPQLPEDLRSRLLSSVDDQVRNVQGQLEKQVSELSREKFDRNTAEQRLRTIRDNALTAVLTESASPADADQWGLDITKPPHRRVIPG